MEGKTEGGEGRGERQGEKEKKMPGGNTREVVPSAVHREQDWARPSLFISHCVYG